MRRPVLAVLMGLLPIVGHAQTYDPSNWATLYQDSTGLAPVTAVGQTVGLMLDTSGAALNLSQPTSTRRCTLQQDARGQSYLSCVKQKCLYSTPTFTLASPAWAVAGYSVVGTGSSNIVFGARKANNAWFGLSSTTSYRALGGMVDPSLGSMTIPTASASVSQGVVTIADALIGTGSVASSVNGGASWPKTTNLPANYTLTGLRVGINTGSAGNTCGGTDVVNFYGGSIVNGPTPDQQTATVAALKSATGIASLEGQNYDIFVVWGQSNANGSGNAAQSPAVPIGVGAEYEDGFIKPLADPTRHYTTTAAGTVSSTGSMWPSFVNAYYQATGRPVLLVGAAVRGVGVITTEGLVQGAPGQGWLSYTPYRQFLIDKALAAQAFVQSHGGTATIRALIFQDGEADAYANVNPATFEAGMGKVRDDLDSALGLPSLPLVCISIDKTTDPNQDTEFATIRGAINDFCTTQPNAFMVAGYQDFADAGELVDAIHWNQTALNFEGTLAGQNTAAALLTLP